MSNTRYTFAELINAQAVGLFETGKTVTIEVYDAKTGIAETLTSDVCVEIGTTGIFVWEFSDLQTVPAIFTQLLYVMTDNSAPAVKRREMVDTGGWVELVTGGGTPSIPANTCKITTSLFNADGACVLDPNDLFDQNLDNWIELKSSYFANSRYFKLSKYQPSYDQQTGEAFWIMPQGATVDVKVDIIGVTETGLVVPDDLTVDLAAWIANA